MNPTSHPCFTERSKFSRKEVALETSLLQLAQLKGFFNLLFLQRARAALRAELAKKYRKGAGHADAAL